MKSFAARHVIFDPLFTRCARILVWSGWQIYQCKIFRIWQSSKTKFHIFTILHNQSTLGNSYFITGNNLTITVSNENLKIAPGTYRPLVRHCDMCVL